MRRSEEQRRPNFDGPCAQCGARVVRYRRKWEIAARPAFCTKSCATSYAHAQGKIPKQRKGAGNYQWKGDEVSVRGGRSRALRAFPPGPCEVCGKPNGERHHRDGNTANNSPENIARLCRRHHMEADGRLASAPDRMRAIQALGVAARWGSK